MAKRITENPAPVVYNHATQFPSRRVYKVVGSQKEAWRFLEYFKGMAISTHGKIKYILV